MIRRPPRSTPLYSSAASDVYKRQVLVFLRLSAGQRSDVAREPLHLAAAEAPGHSGESLEIDGVEMLQAELPGEGGLTGVTAQVAQVQQRLLRSGHEGAPISAELLRPVSPEEVRLEMLVYKRSEGGGAGARPPCGHGRGGEDGFRDEAVISEHRLQTYIRPGHQRIRHFIWMLSLIHI